MLVAQYTPVRWRSPACGAEFVLALGLAGLTVVLAGRVFDVRGSFDPLYLWLAAAVVTATVATLLPSGRRRLAAVPAGADRKGGGAPAPDGDRHDENLEAAPAHPGSPAR